MSMQFVNIAIVLVAMYVALSLACSWIQEQIAALTRLRSTTLESGIRALVADEAVFAKLAEHPLIISGADRRGWLAPYVGDAGFPSYVDKRNFSLAYWQAIAAVASPAAPLLAHLAPAAALADLTAIVNGWAPIPDTPAAKVKSTAVALLTSAQGDYEKLLAATDDWFDSQMDRVSGWYKRTAQYWMLGIALVLAVGTGFDTIRVARQLFAQPEIANALAASEAEVAKDKTGTDGIQDVANVLLQSQQLQTLQLFWWSPPPQLDSSAAKPPVPNPTCTPPPGTPPSGGPQPELELPVTKRTVPETIAGLLLTFIAISLGAPFWFDILKTLVNVRNAGNKPPNDPSSTASKTPAEA
jgi:hypothetical protein